MSYGKTIFAVLLMFAYPLAAGFCLLERAAYAEVVNCCPNDSHQETSPNLPCEGEGCCPVKFAVYVPQSFDTGEFTAPLLETLSQSLPFPSMIPLVELPDIPREWPPPEIPVSWRFISRSAPSPRAPSLLS